MELGRGRWTVWEVDIALLLGSCKVEPFVVCCKSRRILEYCFLQKLLVVMLSNFAVMLYSVGASNN